MSLGVILYGPPGSGKDTVTGELERVDERYTHFRRLKVGGGRSAGYRMVTHAELAQLREVGALIYENERYGATYAIDRPGLNEIVNDGRIPVVHLGQTAGIAQLIDGYAVDWIAVGLWCRRDEAARRIANRGDDTTTRLAVWDETLADVGSQDPGLFVAFLDTSTLPPATVARIIHTIAAAIAPDALASPP